MRNLFFVVAKLLGLLQIFASFAYVTQSALAIGVYRSWVENQLSIYTTWTIYVWGLFIILSLSLAWVLVAKTEWLADRLRIPDHMNNADLRDGRVLRLGVKLLGFYFLGHAVPYLGAILIRSIYEHHGDSPLSNVFPFFLGGFIPLAQITIPLFFILDTDRVAQHIGRCRESEPELANELPPSDEEPDEMAPSR